MPKCFYIKFCVFILLLAAVWGVAQGQNMNTMGTDFWFGYMHNGDGSDVRILKVLVSGPRACTVTLENPNTSFTVTRNISANSVVSISVPSSEAYHTQSCVVSNTGLHLTSSDSVSVYCSIQGTYNYEVANVFPTRVLRNEYIVQSYPSDKWGSEFMVLSTEDSTYVDIYLSSPTSTGYAAGSQLSVLLPKAGQTYQVMGAAVSNFSGTRVHSRDCKPVAVFHGDVCPYIPQWTPGESCDHVVEQAVPVSYWGKDFIVVNTGTNFPDRVRVTTLRDGCTVTKNGAVVSQLNAGETYEFYAGGSTTANFIHTSQPSMVNSYFSSTHTSSFGDPSMVTISPTEQMIKRVTFASFNSQFTTSHYVVVVTRTADVGMLLLDGASRASSFTVSTLNPEYSYAKIIVTAGSHTLESLGGSGFTAYAFGMGNHESYGYLLGSNMLDLEAYIALDGQRVTEYDTVDVCQGDTVTITAYAEYDYDSLTMNVGGVCYSDDTVQKSFVFPGVYNVYAVFRQTDNLCKNEYDTLFATVRVIANDTVSTDYAHCGDSYMWYDRTLDSTGTYTREYTNNTGCKTTEFFTLTLLSDTSTTLLRVGCDSVEYEGNYYFDGDTLLVATYTAANGCDSTVYVAFKHHPSYEQTIYIHLPPNDTLVWIDGLTYTESSDSTFVVLHSVNGCDSTVHLNLVVDHEPPVLDTFALWVPNAFTPDEKTNNRFVIKSNKITYMHVYIYNRLGLYVTDFDGLNEGWDGTYRGTKCKQDAYVYHIKYTTEGRPRYVQTKTGTVTLLR